MNKHIKEKILATFETQVALARFMGVSKTAVTHWFYGPQKISAPHAAKLAKRINVELTDIREDLK